MTELFSGSWSDKITWQVMATTEKPPREVIASAFCTAIMDDGRILLARSARGWGLLEGHIELGESPEEALLRESLEEGGFTPLDPQLYAMMRITSEERTLKPHSTTDYYPFPHSHQLYYWATTAEPLTEPFGEEILEARSFSLAEIEALDIPDFRVIQLGVEAYRLAALAN